jgi:aspartate/methionine/tyrosine aminotransferase
MDPGCLGLTAGASSVIDPASYLLGDAGDVAVFPAPSYPAYTHDVGATAGLERYDLVTHHEPSDIDAGPLLSTVHLDRALYEIQSAGKRFSLLVVTTPDNPTGGIFDRSTLEALSDWCIEHHVHLLVNEIYGLSLVDTRHPELMADYADDASFSSFGPVLEEKRSDYLHYCYAFSKDFGISGFRLGVVYSRNADFMRAFATLNLSHMASNHSQWLLQSLLEDRDFVRAYVAENRRLLTEAYVEVIKVLRRCEIPYVPSRGSLFVWIDLSEFLSESTPESEEALWMEIFRDGGVLLTPGNGFGHTRRGLFRVVYPGLARQSLVVAMERLERFVTAKRSR